MLCPTVYAAADSGECGCSWISRGKQREADPEKSIGIVNVNQRIRLFYGEEYGIQIRSRKQMGTEVEIILPVKMQSENMKKLGEEVEEDVSGVDRR